MSGLIWVQLFDTLLVFLKEIFVKVNFEKCQQTTKDDEIFSSIQRVLKYLKLSQDYNKVADSTC